MKKFIVYLLVIILTVSMGFAVFYLVRDNEVISISSASMYKDVGDKFTIDINHINKKSSTELSVTSSDEDIVDGRYDSKNGTYTAEAKSGGVARINVRTTNAKFRNLWCDVIVGDGTVESPFYISTAEQLAAIGMGAEIMVENEDGTTTGTGVFAGSGDYARYASNLCYKLVANINASEINQGHWVPLRNFNGRLDGNGMTISNIYIDSESYKEALGDSADPLFGSNKPAGLFESIGENGIVYNLKLDNFMAVGTYSSFGTITAINKGTIERVEVKDAFTSVVTGVFGGIAGSNTTTETLVEKTDADGNPIATYVRNVARIDRCSVILNHGQKINNDSTLSVLGATGTIGGIVGINDGGSIVYSYVRGDIYFGDDSVASLTYGGIVGMNRVVSSLHFNTTYKDESQYQGASVKDCYSDLRTIFISTPSSASKIAGAVAVNIDSKNGVFGESDHKVNSYLIGVYYNKDNLNYEQDGITKDFNGIAEFSLNGNNVTFEDTKTIVYGLTAEEMLSADNFVSHTTKTVEFNEDGTSKGVVEKKIYWLFDTVWVTDAETNDGMPYLNYQLIYVPDDFGTVGVPVVPSTLDGYYYKVEINYPVSIISGVDGKLRIKVNDYYQLIYSPTGIDITWTSSDTSVVTVDANGKLLGIKAGVASVTAKTKTGSTDTITVIVENIPYAIDIPETIYMYVGDKYNLKDIITVTPSSEAIKYVLQTTDGKVTDIASISSTDSDNILLVANKEGTAVLYVSIADTKVQANVVITTRPPVTLTASPRTVGGYFENMTRTGTITITANDSITNNSISGLTYTYTVKSGSGIVNLGFDTSDKSKLKYEIVGTGNAVVNISIANDEYSGNIDIYFNIKSETSVDLTLSSATITGYYSDIKKSGAVTITNSANTPLAYKASSSNSSVVSASMSGNSMDYTILGVGSATVTIEVTTTGYVGVAYVNFQVLKDPSTGEGGDIGNFEFVDLNYSSFSIYVGDSLTLVATGNYSSVTWSSSSPSVASVGNGVVSALSAGSTTITAMSGSGAKAQCYVTVKNAPTSGGVSISLKPTSVTLYQGETKQLNASGYGYSSVTWGSANSSIASVNASGLVTASASGSGTTTITAYAKDSNGTTKATATTTVTVIAVPTTITLSINQNVVNKGTNVVVTANINKSGSVTWNSTTPDSCESKNGNTLTINTSNLSIGTYTVTATYGSSSAQVTFTVQDPNAYPTNGYIYNLAQLNAIRYHLDKDFTLAADISVGDWTPIGSPSNPFTGTLKNLGSYELTNIRVSGATYAGLFGYISKSGTSVSGIIVKDSTITGSTYAGAIVAYSNSSAVVSSCSVDSSKITTTSSGYAGGIVGRANSSTISYCTSSATISALGGGYAGGIVGLTNASVYGCLVTSTISTPTSTGYAGGITGYTYSDISNSTIRNSSITGYYAGGIAGTLNRGTSLKLTFKDYKSGYRYEDLDHSQSNLSSASASVYTVAVKDTTTIKGVMAGGLFGVLQSGLVKNCYTRATISGVSGSSCKAGFACDINSSGFKNAGGSGQVGIIMYCYAAVKFSGSGYSYAVTRSTIHNHATVDTYRSAGYIMQYVFDNDTDGNATYSYGNSSIFSSDKVQAKKSTSDMQSSSTYTAKGFSSSVWNFGGYPTLKGEK